MVTEKVTVRLTEDTVAVLETLVISGEYDSMSDIVMAAINDYLKNKFTLEQLADIMEKKSGHHEIDPGSLIDQKEMTDFDNAVRDAVSMYVKNRANEQR